MSDPANTAGCPDANTKLECHFCNELRLCQHRAHRSSGQGGILSYREPSAAIYIRFKPDLRFRGPSPGIQQQFLFVPSISKLSSARVPLTVCLAESVALSSWPSEDPSSIGLEMVFAPRKPRSLVVRAFLMGTDCNIPQRSPGNPISQPLSLMRDDSG